MWASLRKRRINRFEGRTLPPQVDEKDAMVAVWKFSRAAIEHENTLIHNRLLILLQSHAFLFAAFGLVFVTLAKDTDPANPAQDAMRAILTVIALFGVYICIVIQQGVARANDALADMTQHYHTLLRQTANNWLPPVHKWSRPWPFMDHQHLPVALMIVWVLIIWALASWEYQIPGGTSVSAFENWFSWLSYVAIAAAILGLWIMIRNLRRRFYDEDLESCDQSGRG